MRDCELTHDDSADFCARVTLIFLQANAVAPVAFLAMDGPFKEWEELRQVLLRTTLV